MGVSPKWLAYNGKSMKILLKWVITRGIPISGNLHMRHIEGWIPKPSPSSQSPVGAHVKWNHGDVWLGSVCDGVTGILQAMAFWAVLRLTGQLFFSFRRCFRKTHGLEMVSGSNMETAGCIGLYYLYYRGWSILVMIIFAKWNGKSRPWVAS